jgi:hypothetical protein
MARGQARACWQIKGLLLLGLALVGTGLAASTAGADSAPSREVVPDWRLTEAAARPPDGATTVSKPSWCCHGE